MSVRKEKIGPFTQAEGVQQIDLSGELSNYAYHTVNIEVVDTATGNRVQPIGGTFTLRARRNGSNIWEPLDQGGTIEIATVGGWDIIRVPIEAVEVTPAGFDGDKSYYINVNGSDA